MRVNLQDVTYTQHGKVILDSLTWQVHEGEHWALLGCNGSGKTTLLNIVNGYLWPRSGSVKVLNESFGKTDLRALRKRIGWVSASLSQTLQSFRPEERVLDVVVSGKFASLGVYEKTSDADVEDAQALLDLFGCIALADASISTLSQGERQRVLIARAFMADAEILILDEPCSGLDVPNRERLLTAIENWQKQVRGATLLYVTHHVEEILPSITHVCLLENGQIYAQGEKQKVLTDDALSHIYGVPVHVTWAGGRPWLQVHGG